MSEPVQSICGRLTELQALLQDHFECGKYTTVEALQKAKKILNREDLLWAMWEIGYFQSNTSSPSKRSTRKKRAGSRRAA